MGQDIGSEALSMWNFSIFSAKTFGFVPVPMMSVDSETKVPGEVYREFMMAGKRAKARGQHTLKRKRGFLGSRTLVRNS